MVHFMRIILAVSIVVLAVNNVIVDAGIDSENRKKNLSDRALKHEKKLQLLADEFKSTYGGISNSVTEQLTSLNNIIIDHILGNEQFQSYLKTVFKTLQAYAEGQIESRFKSLETLYTNWEKENFPSKKIKNEVKNKLINEGIINEFKDKEKKTGKKSSPKAAGTRNKKIH